MKRQPIVVVAVTVFFLLSPWVSVDVRADVFFDDFEDGNTDGWWLSPRGNWSVANGILDTKATPSGYDHVMGLVENLTFSDQVIGTKVNTSGYGGVVLWYQDRDHYIYVCAYPYSSGIYVGERGYGTLHYPERTGVNRWHDLSVDADATTGELAIYLDGAYVFTYNASTPYRTGLSGVTFGNGGAYFDDFSIVPVPSCFVLGVLGLSMAGLKLRKRA